MQQVRQQDGQRVASVERSDGEVSEVLGGPADLPRPERDYEPTGNATVDEVVESFEHLEGAPVSEHVLAFESAHEKLRDLLGNDNRGS